MNFRGDGNGKKEEEGISNLEERKKKEVFLLDLESGDVPLSSCIFLSQLEVLPPPPISRCSPKMSFDFRPFPIPSSFRRPHILLLVPFGGGNGSWTKSFEGCFLPPSPSFRFAVWPKTADLPIAANRPHHSFIAQLPPYTPSSFYKWKLAELCVLGEMLPFSIRPPPPTFFFLFFAPFIRPFQIIIFSSAAVAHLPFSALVSRFFDDQKILYSSFLFLISIHSILPPSSFPPVCAFICKDRGDLRGL
jgi:hypothetical protein